MNRSLIIGLVTAVLIISGALAWAEGDKDPFKFTQGDIFIDLGGQYRARYEYNEGKDFAENTDMDFFSHRARFNFGAGHEQYFRFFASLQDVRFWGEEASTLGDYNADNFDLHQGYGEVFLDDLIKLRIGRQEIIYDNHRLIGNVNWTQQGRSFDAVKMQIKISWFTGTFFWALLQDDEISPAHAAAVQAAADEAAADDEDDDADDDNNDDADADADTAPVNPFTVSDPLNMKIWDVWSAHLHFAPVDPFNISLVYIFDEDTGLRRYRSTAGTYINGKVAGFAYSAEGYYQFGDWEFAGTDLDIAAYMAGARAGYTFDVTTKPHLSAWAEMLSGDDDFTDDKVEVFDTLFATNHKFYGYMDLFLNLPVHTGGLGLTTFGGRFQLQPVEAIKLFADVHSFSTTEANAADETALGTEVDIVASIKLNKYVTFSGGYGIFLPGKAMETMKGGDENENFGFATTDFSF